MYIHVDYSEYISGGCFALFESYGHLKLTIVHHKRQNLENVLKVAHLYGQKLILVRKCQR